MVKQVLGWRWVPQTLAPNSVTLAPNSVTLSMPDDLSASQDHHSGNGDVRGGDLYRSLVFYNLLLERKRPRFKIRQGYPPVISLLFYPLILAGDECEPLKKGEPSVRLINEVSQGKVDSLL